MDNEVMKPDAVYRIWDSTQDIIDFADWLPEVVGNREELIKTGSVPIPLNQLTANQVTAARLRFIDTDVSKYKRYSTYFRKSRAVR